MAQEPGEGEGYTEGDGTKGVPEVVETSETGTTLWMATKRTVNGLKFGNRHSTLGHMHACAVPSGRG